jgi:transposase
METLTSQQTLTSQNSSDLKEWRRLRAYELSQQGWKHNRIARALDVTEGAVSQWLARVRTQGLPSLQRRKPPGRKARLSPEQKEQIKPLLAQGAPAFGFIGDVWTRRRVQAVIRDKFGVGYHVSHIGRLLHALGYSRQKPEIKATQRDEAAITDWKQREWPRLKRGQ